MRMGIFTGNLGKDWEKKAVGSNTVYENTLAVKCGKDNKDTMWVKLSQWNEKAGDALTQYTGKGTKLLVTGDVDVGAYKDKNGDAKPDLRIRINSFEFLSFKDDKAEEQKPEPVPEEVPF